MTEDKKRRLAAFRAVVGLWKDRSDAEMATLQEIRASANQRLEAGDVQKPIYTNAERSALARGLVSLLDKWRLTNAEQRRLLPGIERYRAGSPLDDDSRALERAANLLAIHHSLVRLYPESPDLIFGWVSTPDAKLEGRSPAGIMLSEGRAGILRIRQLLDDMLGR